MTLFSKTKFSKNKPQTTMMSIHYNSGCTCSKCGCSCDSTCDKCDRCSKCCECGEK